MKRINSLLILVLLAYFATTARAQGNVFVWSLENEDMYDGSVEAIRTIISEEDVDSLTFTVSGSSLFNITTLEATSVATKSFQASVKVAFAEHVKSLSYDPTIGVCLSSVNEMPTLADDYMVLSDYDYDTKSYNFTVNGLEPGTTYYYRAYVKWAGNVFYGDVKSVTTYGERPTVANYTLINGHKFVDLGLPSGLLWACNNIGALSPSDGGDTFQWGAILSSWDYFTWEYSNYPLESDKYNASDNKFILEPKDDAATVLWGEGCRMPSSAEFQELYDNCAWTWQDYPAGYIVTGPNANSIFLPAALSRSGDAMTVVIYGGYWSRSLRIDYPQYAYVLSFTRGYIDPESYEERFGYKTARSVRPVAEK